MQPHWEASDTKKGITCVNMCVSQNLLITSIISGYLLIIQNIPIIPFCTDVRANPNNGIKSSVLDKLEELHEVQISREIILIIKPLQNK